MLEKASTDNYLIPFFVGSLINGYLATYIIIAVLITHAIFPQLLPQILYLENTQKVLLDYIFLDLYPDKNTLSKLIIVYLYTILLMGFFIGYSLLISVAWLGTGELAVFHKGLLFYQKMMRSFIFYAF